MTLVERQRELFPYSEISIWTQDAKTVLELNETFGPWAERLLRNRTECLAAAHCGRLPNYNRGAYATRIRQGDWRIELPGWCRDQRNQMTGPADQEDLCVKMLNSGAPGVMLDIEDSMKNQGNNPEVGIWSYLSALAGELRYQDKKSGEKIGIKKSDTVIWLRVRGLHLHQRLRIEGKVIDVPAPLFDLAYLFDRLDPAWLGDRALCIYIPKSESAIEAAWWRDLFEVLLVRKGMEQHQLKCMALVESFPLVYQMEEFIYHLRQYIVGLNFGRWDYLASFLDYLFHYLNFTFADRNTIAHDTLTLQRPRQLMVETCHKRGILAIGGMTALYPDRKDAAQNNQALAILESDKCNEASIGMDGAWTGHPDQNEIAVKQFPFPNQISRRYDDIGLPQLRHSPLGDFTTEGIRQAIHTVIRYRAGVLAGRGASLINGYMEDLATDRIYRLMLAHRLRHGFYKQEDLEQMFSVELTRLVILAQMNCKGDEEDQTENLHHARDISLRMILEGIFDPW